MNDKKSQNRRKGVIFTLDAIVAMLAAALMITSSYFYLTGSEPSQWQIIDLEAIASDSLASLEMNDDLEDVIASGSTSTLNTYINAMLPERICSRIRIYNSEKALLYNTVKANCNITSTRTIAVSFRSFIAQDRIYYAKMENWYEY